MPGIGRHGFDNACSAEFAHEDFRLPIELGGTALLDRLLLRREVGAKIPAARHQPASKLPAFEIVLMQRVSQVFTGIKQHIGETLRVERRFGHTGADVGTRNESRVTKQDNSAENELWRLKIIYRLKQRLRRLVDQGGDLGRQHGVGMRAQILNQLFADQRRRYRFSVAMSRLIGTEISQPDLAIDRTEPAELASA